MLKQQIVPVLNGKIIQVGKRNRRDRENLSQVLKRRGEARKIVGLLKLGRSGRDQGFHQLLHCLLGVKAKNRVQIPGRLESGIVFRCFD